MNLIDLYDGISMLQYELSAEHHDAEVGCLDYKVIKVLAATYELQEYLANRIYVEYPDPPEVSEGPGDEGFRIAMEKLAEYEGARLQALADWLNADPTAAVPERVSKLIDALLKEHFGE